MEAGLQAKNSLEEYENRNHFSHARSRPTIFRAMNSRILYAATGGWRLGCIAQTA
jgi:hypothetical protein